MGGFESHLFVCCNRREPGHRRGCCDPTGGEQLRNAFKAEVKRRKLETTVRANVSGCLDQCEHGPVIVIYPQGIWYGHVQVSDVERILEETVIGGKILEDLLIPEECLNNPNCPHRSGWK